MTQIDKTKLREIFDRGLTNGLGKVDGQMCVEAAISVACGEGLNDTPACVAIPDRVFAITINDAPWSSPRARSEALYPLALAQLGTAGKYRRAWVERVAIGTINRVLPILLRGRIDDALVDTLTHASSMDEARAAADAAYDAAAYAARAAALAAADVGGDGMLLESVQIALDAYAAEAM